LLTLSLFCTFPNRMSVLLFEFSQTGHPPFVWICEIAPPTSNPIIESMRIMVNDPAAIPRSSSLLCILVSVDFVCSIPLRGFLKSCSLCHPILLLLNP
jgi:hypothetical protein